ncbi:hypothetical protein BP5796_01226 [Coleophoma crateriformis]|uniref:Uncharacterized protein n=1 Tax=Coleophoma crateriformis TaxID=565419 RepID=A0A3D8SZU3_9HELO|nr:hypothetical protein BP5796_01226 [Coleophoma crateriformis]
MPPFTIIVRPNPNSPLQLLSDENDAGELTATDLYPRAESPAVLARQTNAVIPSGYSNQNSLAPGTIVGIVLGSVAGFLLVLWLLYTCMNFNQVNSRSSYNESVVVRDRRKSVGSHRSRRMSETVEVRRERSRTPVRIVRPEPPRSAERVVVEERREVRRERSPDGSDEVVVIEEHSPPRRSKSKRETIETRRESGFRTVDPGAYGGGAAPLRGVKTSRRSSGR